MSDLTDAIADANRYADEHARAWRDERIERAARIRNIMQALMLAAEDAARDLYQSGDLSRDLRTPEKAGAYFAAIAKDMVLDALSLTAQEALDVAGEAQ